MKKRPVFLFFIGITCLVLMPGCRKKQEEIQEKLVVPVKLAPVERNEMAKSLHTYGRVASRKEMKLSFKVGGIIDKIFGVEGETVEKGQLLASLDLSEIESQVTQARSAFEKAKRDRDRMERLFSEKAITLEQYQNIQTAFQMAKSQLDAVEFNLRYSRISAPTRGRILKRLVEENEIVGAGMPVFLFASTEKGWIVRVGVSDSDLVRVKLGDAATVAFDAYPGKEFAASVSEIVESADPLTGTYELELELDSGEMRLASGFVAEVDIFPSAKQLYSIIPVEALVEAEGHQGYVYTIDPGSNQARRLPVTIGFLFGDRVAVESGLEAITHVVSAGAPYLSEGVEVKVTVGAEIPRDKSLPRETEEAGKRKP